MWGWFKKKSKICTEADIRFLLLLCLGSGADTEQAVQKHLGTGVFAALKSILASPRFEDSLLTPLKLGQKPYNIAYSNNEKSIINNGLDKHFKDSATGSGTYVSAFVAALQSPRFQRALEGVHPSLKLSDLSARLKAHEEQVSGRYTVHMDGVNGATVSGFAFNTDDPEKQLTLKFFVNGIYLGSALTQTLRRDAEDLYGHGKSSGFEHTLALPDYLGTYTTLVLHIFDAESEIMVCPPYHFAPTSARSPYYIQRLVSDIHELKQQGSSQALQEKLDEVIEFLPDIKRYAAFELQNYKAFASLYSPPKPPHVPSDAPTISRAETDTALIAAKTDLIIVAPRGARVTETAPLWFQEAAIAQPDAQIFFADHTTLGGAVPVLKSRFDADLLLQDASYAGAFAIRREMLEEIGGPRQNMKQAVWQDLWLRVLAGRGSTAFHHIPQILFDMPAVEITQTSSQAALKSYFNSQVISAQVAAHSDRYGGTVPSANTVTWPLDPETPHLAIIIPTRDRLELIETCLSSIRATLEHPYHTEIIIIDNGSTDEDMRNWLRNADNMDGVRVIMDDSPFNWSALNNKAVAATDADYLLFLNNDTKALDHGWDTILRGHLHRPDIGCIGARLLFEDGTIQYAGYVLDEDNIVLKEGYSETTATGGYMNRTKLTHATSAVIGAFLACRRSVFEDVGGFDATDFAVAYNDVDFSLRAQEKGYRNLYVPAITFEHYESKSRSYDHLDTEKQKRVAGEKQRFLKKHCHQMVMDPWYPSLFLRCEPTHRLLAAPVLPIKAKKQLEG